MLFTGGSTWLFAAGLPTVAFAALIVGSILWAVVGLRGSFGGRPIYGIILSSINTVAGAIYGLWRLWWSSSLP